MLKDLEQNAVQSGTRRLREAKSLKFYKASFKDLSMLLTMKNSSSSQKDEFLIEIH